MLQSYLWFGLLNLRFPFIFILKYLTHEPDSANHGTDPIMYEASFSRIKDKRFLSKKLHLDHIFGEKLKGT